MKKKLGVFISLLAMIFSVNAAVDPFHFAGRGAERLNDGLEHELFYLNNGGLETVIKIKNPIENKYCFRGSKKAVYNFSYFLHSILSIKIDSIQISKSGTQYFGEFYNANFVDILNASINFLGIDLP